MLLLVFTFLALVEVRMVEIFGCCTHCYGYPELFPFSFDFGPQFGMRKKAYNLATGFARFRVYITLRLKIAQKPCIVWSLGPNALANMTS